MKKNVNRMLALLLATAMAVTMLGCGGKEESTPAESSSAEESQESAEVVEEETYYNKTGFPICDEPITVTVSGETGTTKDWNNTLMVKTIEEELGIKLDCNPYEADVWKTQLSLMMVDDTLPDLLLIAKISTSDARKMGEDGYLLDLSQYLDIMPNLSKLLEENPNYAMTHMDENGRIYGIGNVRRAESSNALTEIYVSKADMEKYGFDLAELSTTEGFYNALKKIKETDPDRIPFTLTFGQNRGQRTEWTIRNAFGVHSTSHSTIWQADENGKVQLMDISDEYREYLRYMNKLYEEGLLDNESFIQTNDELGDKMTNGKAVFVNSWSMQTSLGRDGSWVNDYEVITGMTSEFVDHATYAMMNPVTNEVRVAVNANTKYPEAICRLLDYTLSDEGALLFGSGVEGETYDLVEDEVGNQIVNYDKYWDQANYETASQWLYADVIINNGLMLFQDSAVEQYISNASVEELQKIVDEGTALGYLEFAQEWLSLKKQNVELIYPYPNIVYTVDEIAEKSTIAVDLNTYLTNMKAEFIMGKMDIDKDWESYVGEVQKMDLERVLEIEQAAYDRAMAAIK